MDAETKSRLVDQQIAEGRGGDPTDFNLWRQKTDVVLRNVLGDTNPLYKSFVEISYNLSTWSDRTPQSAFSAARARGVKEAIAILGAAKTEIELTGGAPSSAAEYPPLGNKVFIVHGRNDARKYEVARVLMHLTKFEPVILHEQANQGRTLLEKFESVANEAAYAVVIATGDDLGRAADESDDRPRARQNVILELGFFFGLLGRERVALLYEDGIERPSDIDGIARINLDDGGGWKLQLARELDNAGLGIDWSALR